MQSRIITIARYTVLEAVRTRLALLTVVMIGVIFTASLFVREIAIIETARFQTGTYAAIMRLAIVFVAALYAIASIAREFQDKGLARGLSDDQRRFGVDGEHPTHTPFGVGGCSSMGNVACFRARSGGRDECVLRRHVQSVDAGGEPGHRVLPICTRAHRDSSHQRPPNR
ncbi:MAG: hypothetical protein V4637_10885 [Pseudomonadota bacterium]